MRMRSYRRNLVTWGPSAGLIDRFRARRFPRIARTWRHRKRPLLLAAGALLIAMSVALPSSIAFAAGLLVLGLSAPDALPWTPDTAIVRSWESSRKSRTGHR